MKTYILTFTMVSCMLTILMSQEVKHTKHIYGQISPIGTLNVGSLEDPYMPALVHTEAPAVSGNAYRQYLSTVKETVSRLYPKKDMPSAQNRSTIEPPMIVDSYRINGISVGIPIDNHLCMHEDYIISAGNSYMTIRDRDNNTLKTVGLSSFRNQTDVTGFPFDPRLAYDQVEDRYILTFLAGFESAETAILIAFSATNDPLCDWYVYSITGNPNNLTQWTDYPMISITDEHVYVTINLLRDNESWQLGFVETLIWEMNKSTAYAGTDLGLVKYGDITLDGAPIRNLCPVESATEELYSDLYLLSNRNFSVETDSFFLVHLDDEGLDIQVVNSNVPYGVPPNAQQEVGLLQTNDARVLEAFRLGNHVQFVGNTRNLGTNTAGIYHGIIRDLNQPTIELHHITGDTYEVGYPGITYTGAQEGDLDAIISLNHTAADRFAGVSALYSIPDSGYSEIIEVAEGSGYIDQLQGDVERWGDYMGTQRDYQRGDQAWICGTIGIFNQKGGAWVAQLSKPGVSTSIQSHETIESKIYPNPVNDRVYVSFDIPAGSQQVEVRLADSRGQIIDKIYDTSFFRTGSSEFSFSTAELSYGIYLVTVVIDGDMVVTKKIVK